MNHASQQGTKLEDNVAQTALTTTTETNASGMAAMAQAEVLARYTMADRRPREWLNVHQRVLADCSRPTFAKAARYRKPVGQGIFGPSIRFAESCLRNAGNMSCEGKPSSEDRYKRVVVVTVTDYETNAVFSAPVTIPKTVERQDAKGREVLSQRMNSQNRPVFTVEATEDEILNTQNALISKTMRTLILRMIPADIIEDGQARCIAVQEDADAKDPQTAVRELAANFLRFGVTAAQLAEYLGHTLEAVSRAELIDLRAVGAAIADNETTWAATVAERRSGTDGTPKADAPKTDDEKEADLNARIDAAKRKQQIQGVSVHIANAKFAKDSPHLARVRERYNAKKAELDKPKPAGEPASAPAAASPAAQALDTEATALARDQAEYEAHLAENGGREPGEEG
jgi:hypothetical protein